MVQSTFYASTDVEVTGNTKVFGIIGEPVAHSLSPLFQARYAAQHDIDAVYIAMCVARENVARALDGLWAADVQGLNVTVPHKETVAAMVQADTAARLIGAVNTLRRGPQGWQGTNTDHEGIRYALLHELGVELQGLDVLLIGAGGTARAVLHALAAEKVKCVHVCNRSPDRLEGLIRHASEAYAGMEVRKVAWDQHGVEACALRCPLVINTTSIGLDGGERFPFAIGGIGAALDAVYCPDGRTPFVEAASQGGRRVVDGLPMLLAQGAASFQWWHELQVEIPPVMAWMKERLGRCQLDKVQ